MAPQGKRDKYIPLREDWFRPALNPSLSLYEAFKEAAQVSERRFAFAACLQRHFQPDSQMKDKFTAVQEDLSSLAATLEYRLAMLRPEASDAWFREYTQKINFIFKSPIFRHPIFKPFDPSKTSEFKEVLRLAFSEGAPPDSIPFEIKGTLWGEMLRLKHELTRLSIMKGQFGHIDFLRGDYTFAYPECASESLHFFIETVKNRLLTLQEQCEISFQKLWQASQAFWVIQQQMATGREKGKKDPYVAYAQELRQEFKQKRLEAKWIKLSWHEREALNFLGFTSLPTAAALRSRYLELVKAHHPDRSREEGDQFKKVVFSYELLKGRIAETKHI